MGSAGAILIAATAMLASGANGQFGGNAADRATIIAGERAWGQSFVNGNVATIRRLVADDFSGTDTTGAIYGKAGMIADLKEGRRITSDRVNPIEVRFYGDTAVVQAHEFIEGPKPEAHPSQRVFTDTWMKRNGRWQIIAAHDTVIGLPTLPQYRSEIAQIRSARAANNTAIAAHDIDAFLPMYADDAVFTWSNGTSAVGRIQLRIFFLQDFFDPNFTAYVRTPSSISVSDRGIRAVEHGTWTALKRGTRYGGDYMAHWMKTADGWRVRGEVYVKLYCSGPLCTP
jgi:ketosteroid isomerase-like protein